MADAPSDRDRAAREQEQRATETITAIFAGADLADETLRLSNEYTDRQVVRLRALFIRKGRTTR